MADKVVIQEDKEIRVITIGIPGPPGAGVSFNDAQGDPVPAGTSTAEDGTSNFAARRDHKHQVDLAELDARYGLEARSFSQPFTNQLLLTIEHNLNKRPSVTIIDTAGDEIEGAVNHIDLNSLTVSFSASFSGIVICN